VLETQVPQLRLGARHGQNVVVRIDPNRLLAAGRLKDVPLVQSQRPIATVFLARYDLPRASRAFPVGHSLLEVAIDDENGLGTAFPSSRGPTGK